MKKTFHWKHRQERKVRLEENETISRTQKERRAKQRRRRRRSSNPIHTLLPAVIAVSDFPQLSACFSFFHASSCCLFSCSLLAFQKRPRRFVVVIVVSFSLAVVRGAELRFLRFSSKERSFLRPEAKGRQWMDYRFSPVRFSSRQLAVEFSFAFLFSDNAGLPRYSNVRENIAFALRREFKWLLLILD